jgi:DNA-directed RNA polymerase subunit RPC12/RpoP
MTAPLIFYKPCSIGDTYFRECLTCGAIVKNEGLHTLYHEQQASPKRCPRCGLLDIGRHICPNRQICCILLHSPMRICENRCDSVTFISGPEILPKAFGSSG